MKKLCLFLMLISISIGSIFASPAAIDLNEAVGQDENLKNLMVDFLDVFDSISYPDVSPNPKPKDEELTKAKALYDALKKIKKPNCDQELTELLVLRCLYNYDKVGSKDVVKKYEAIVKKYKDNAGVHWIYANFLSYCGKGMEAVEQYEQYLDMTEGHVSGYFLEDYAYGQLMAGMPLNAYYTITNGYSIQDKKVENQALLKLIKDNIKASKSSKVYEVNEVWVKSETIKGKYYIYSTMLGMAIPQKEDYKYGKFRAFDKEEGAIISFGPSDAKVKGKNPNFAYIVYVYPQKLYKTDQVEEGLPSFDVYDTKELKIKDLDFKVYSFNSDGKKGYFYSCKSKPEKTSGAQAERGYSLANMDTKDSDGNAVYTSPASYERLEDTLSIAIIVFVNNTKLKATDAEFQAEIEKYLETWTIK